MSGEHLATRKCQGRLIEPLPSLGPLRDRCGGRSSWFSHGPACSWAPLVLSGPCLPSTSKCGRSALSEPALLSLPAFVGEIIFFYLPRLNMVVNK